MNFKDKTNRRSKGGSTYRKSGAGGKSRNIRKGGDGLQEKIADFFRRNERKRYDAPRLAHKLKLKLSYAEIEDALSKLAERGILKASGEGKYKIVKGSPAVEVAKSPQGIVGKVDMNRNGDAFILVEGFEKDVFVQGRRLKGAMNGDLVKIELKSGGSKRRMEGAVVAVVERAREKYIGKLKIYKEGMAIVDAQDSTQYLGIQINTNFLNGAKDGDVVTCEVTSWPKDKKETARGKILHVLGTPGDNELEMQSILLERGFDPAFSDELIQAAADLEDGTLGKKAPDRKDMRKVTTFTIDPLTAKDFDDAISVEFLSDGHCKIGVHIADVTHYVQPGSIIDKEAFHRSTSVYLVDRVAPMLPERLSNELCSLRPNEDKCTFSAVFTFDAEDNIIKKWFGKTLTHSNRRFTYEEAQEVIETGKGDHVKEIKKIDRMAERMRKARFKNGAINFESDEVQFKLDEQGKPLEVNVKERKAAHLLVEEFMLLANKEVAGFMNEKMRDKAEIPFVYRVHDFPDETKVADFAKFAMELGVKMDVSTPKAIAKSFNMLSKASEDNQALRMLGPMAIRTMAKAIYTTNNIGHYGLGFDNYAHFTSPIRRYADVLVHRILYKNLTAVYRVDKEELETQCKHISSQEKKAADAERASIKYKLVEYMENQVGQIFEGFVTGIIDRGIFVELAGTMAEGMVGFDKMDEPFNVAESRLKAKGKRSGRIIKMGDKIKVEVLEVDMGMRRIELGPAGTSASLSDRR